MNRRPNFTSGSRKRPTPSKPSGLGLTSEEIRQIFIDPEVAKSFPPVLTTDQAARLIQVPKATLYDWSHRGLLKDCSRKVGKHLRIHRDRFIHHVFNGSIHEEA